MWSKRKKKKDKEERLAREGHRPMSSAERPPQQSSSPRSPTLPVGQQQSTLSRDGSHPPRDQSRDRSNPPQDELEACAHPQRDHSRDGSHPPPREGSVHSREGHPRQPDHVSLSVPLPPAPLPSTAILDSLMEGAGGNSSGNAQLENRTPLEIQKVIAMAQRSLIDQITQHLEKNVASEPPEVHARSHHSRDDAFIAQSGHATQTFEYVSQSNVRAAAEQVEHYYDDNSWRT